MSNGWSSLAIGALLLTTSACEQMPSADHRKRDRIDGKPLLGKALFGREDVMILLCEGERKTCDDPRTEAELKRRDCNLTFSQEGSRAFSKFPIEHDNDGNIVGSYWITGRGKHSKEAASYGHLGGAWLRSTL
jgi:hypothetical protein